ncbi:hypothetical protein SYNPS1DRAFT_32109 [Syncephalis pseudoplumigaleata]|uniref:Nuclear speckle splicing regulatory protein 1 N-terminal domain-containing protein n=1 Tax=Syncephalis pseudoplumigaleata TaxID=1712513 RepID=A0A4P9YSI0_9FUNG|nr:hypothetical protein SYNPS1DRAFT_32109 [Syncephalis pseudoplumigaleata]|eukprot:RKP22312.1 hypothetical protein SYNPS1DRAFT_32109 [Syncephalis pseudoplumigaleata]
MSLSFGLNLATGKKRGGQLADKARRPGQNKQRNVFGDASSDDDDTAYYDDDDDGDNKEEEEDKATGKDQRAAQQRVNRDLQQQQQQASKAHGQAEEDASIYAYDEVYDDMKAAERQQRQKHDTQDPALHGRSYALGRDTEEGFAARGRAQDSAGARGRRQCIRR